jgi:hypothetical protein
VGLGGLRFIPILRAGDGMNGTATPTPIQSRLRAIQEKRDAPHTSKFALLPTGMSPFVRAARERRLQPTGIGYSPDGCGPTGRAA